MSHTTVSTTVGKSLRDRVMAAYADANAKTDEQLRDAMQIRNLTFRADEWVPRDQAISILREAIPDGYNNFHADLLEELPADCMVQIAREGSVCLYVNALLPGNPLGANECSVQPGCTRLWWD